MLVIARYGIVATLNPVFKLSRDERLARIMGPSRMRVKQPPHEEGCNPSSRVETLDQAGIYRTKDKILESPWEVKERRSCAARFGKTGKRMISTVT
jgi:hypothetical protein